MVKHWSATAIAFPPHLRNARRSGVAVENQAGDERIRSFVHLSGVTPGDRVTETSRVMGLTTLRVAKPTTLPVRLKLRQRSPPFFLAPFPTPDGHAASSTAKIADRALAY